MRFSRKRIKDKMSLCLKNMFTKDTILTSLELHIDWNLETLIHETIRDIYSEIKFSNLLSFEEGKQKLEEKMKKRLQKKFDGVGLIISNVDIESIETRG